MKISVIQQVIHPDIQDTSCKITNQRLLKKTKQLWNKRESPLEKLTGEDRKQKARGKWLVSTKYRFHQSGVGPVLFCIFISVLKKFEQ